jgi:hypothetical protein
VAEVSISSAPPYAAPLPTVVRLGLVAVAGLLLGVLTAYAQGWLPSQLGSLANSAGLWALVAFLLAWLCATGTRDAALIGSLALFALLIGYAIASNARGFSAGSSLIGFWTLVALFAGPIVGIAGAWARNGQGLRPGVGIGAIAGILVGEGFYGLTYIAGTTFRPYWWAETVVGLILAVWLVSRHPRWTQTAAAAVAIGALTAVAFVVVYSADLISVLP